MLNAAYPLLATLAKAAHNRGLQQEELWQEVWGKTFDVIRNQVTVQTRKSLVYGWK